ncbi:MAG: YbhB/YbcL family Raf kinase inhibitor-like protein [Halobacteriales archaeon]
MSTDNPLAGDATQRGDLALTSPAFDDGDPIPREYGHEARDVNPPLRIAGVPDGAAALVLVMDDPDAVEPAGTVWLHWLVWNIDPERREIPEGWDGGDARQGVNDFGERGYGGPAPPDREHTYRFKLYAVDHVLDLPAGASKAEVGEAVAGGVLARTQLTGTYAP